MIQSTDSPVSLQEAEIDETAIPERQVALIGPNESSRQVVARALAVSGGAHVREYAAYPALHPDLTLLLEAHYDLVIIDVDVDESYALTIIGKVAATGVVVMAYSRRNEQALMLRCMQAGTRDFLPLPAEPVTAASSTEAAQGEAGEEANPSAPAKPAAATAKPLVIDLKALDIPLFQVELEPPRPKGSGLRLLIAGAISMVVVALLAFLFMPQLAPARAGLLERIGIHPAASSR